MTRFSDAIFVTLLTSCLALAGGDGPVSCADSTKLLPFLMNQLKQGSSLVVFEGTSVVQVGGCKLGVGDLGSPVALQGSPLTSSSKFAE